MVGTYWILVDSPRFKWFPWLWRITRAYKKECDYAHACKLYLRALELANSRQIIVLGAGREGGIQLLHASDHE